MSTRVFIAARQRVWGDDTLARRLLMAGGKVFISRVYVSWWQKTCLLKCPHVAKTNIAQRLRLLMGVFCFCCNTFWWLQHMVLARWYYIIISEWAVERFWCLLFYYTSELGWPISELGCVGQGSRIWPNGTHPPYTKGVRGMPLKLWWYQCVTRKQRSRKHLKNR